MIGWLVVLAYLIGLRRNNAPVAWEPPEVPIPLGEWPPDTSPSPEPRPEPDPEVCAHSSCAVAVAPPMIACSHDHYLWWAQSLWNRMDVA